jgi:uncharacterized membrane protein YqhA
MASSPNPLRPFRWLALFPILSVLALALGLTYYGVGQLVFLLQKVLVLSKDKEEVIAQAIQALDMFLLSIVFYMIALSLYELLINPDLALPEWIQIKSIDDLKEKLVNITIVVLGVTFLGRVLTWKEAPGELWSYGLGLALVIVALTYFLQYKADKKKGD